MLIRSHPTVRTDGWTDPIEVWTYVAADQFSTQGDTTAKYQVGTKLKWTQTTVRYGYVQSSSFGGGITTITIITDTDYVIANAAISANFYSYQENPQGFPAWFTYVPTFTGFSVAPTVAARFALNGRVCFVTHYVSGAGTSNATTFTVTLPLNAVEIAFFPTAISVDNGAEGATGRAGTAASSNILELRKSAGDPTWTASGDKYTYLSIFYRV